eukprot:SAG11_NODE_1099_length_5874_cov_17.109784_1_plen_173_part_10
MALYGYMGGRGHVRTYVRPAARTEPPLAHRTDSSTAFDRPISPPCPAPGSRRWPASSPATSPRASAASTPSSRHASPPPSPCVVYGNSHRGCCDSLAWGAPQGPCRPTSDAQRVTPPLWCVSVSVFGFRFSVSAVEPARRGGAALAGALPRRRRPAAQVVPLTRLPLPLPPPP